MGRAAKRQRNIENECMNSLIVMVLKLKYNSIFY